jgi:histidine triad (HIT) family protein
VQVVECLFCRIVTGEIPATVVCQSELSFAFRDISPTAPTHVLVVPKHHIDHAGAIAADHSASVADLFVTAQQVAQIDGIDTTGYRLVFNVGEDSGNTVNHLHLHVIGGRPMGWPPFAG